MTALTLTQIVCDHILANSEAIQDLILNPCDYEKVDIEVGINCCGTTYKETIMIPQTPGCVITDWSITVPKGQTTLFLNGVSFHNLLIGHHFMIPMAAPLQITAAADLVTFFNTTVDTFFHTNYGSPLGSITATVTDTPTTYEVLVKGMPANIVPDHMVFEIDSIEVTVRFTYMVSPNRTMFTAEGIILSHAIVGMDAFPDGVYNIKVTLWRPSGSRVTQQNCLFFDCNTACKVSAGLEGATTEEQTELLVIHYGLTQGSNCACDCDILCKMYQRLHTLLTNTQLSDCGC